MKSSEFKKLIKEAVREVIQEELKDILLEAVRAPKTQIVKEHMIPQVDISSKPIDITMDKKKAYMDVKAAIAALAQEISMEDDSNTSASDEDDNSNTSNTVNGKNYSDEEEGSDSS